MARGAVADTLLGKRSAFLDLDTRPGLSTVHDLLDGADVVVCGYRPGALDRFGLDEESLAGRHPGMVAVYLDAWGHSGPWAGRRGFDSVVQAPTGIAMGESASGGPPGALPCQLLDHGTGYLAAAAALDGVRRQGATGGTHVRRLSLARTALWLTSEGTRPPDGAVVTADEPGAAPWLVELDSARGPVTAVSPPGRLGDRALRWPSPLTGYGADPAAWPAAPGVPGRRGGPDRHRRSAHRRRAPVARAPPGVRPRHQPARGRPCPRRRRSRRSFRDVLQLPPPR